MTEDNTANTEDSFDRLVEQLDAEPGEVSEIVAATTVDSFGRTDLDPGATPAEAIRSTHRETVEFLLEALDTIEAEPGDVTLDEMRDVQDSIMAVSVVPDETDEAGIDRDATRGFY
ncbi:hypothetical protein [Halalkalicoccus subterraneus]|uniref:hypothetical protein n=1 Tax=Halalkalicoccus subterraneus TaxID=2675002 RepID=UPI000EFCD3F4|nr:hypothetical protein [Halalkalicoccus subterraneus]